MSKKNISTFIYSILFCFLVYSIISHPQEAFRASQDGLKLWFNSVLPALLPFFICVEILIGLGIVSFFGSTFKPLMRPIFSVTGEGAFAFFMSIASGYPVGAKITARLRQQKLCTRIEGQRLLNLCSTSGPLFIIGAVATGIMNNPALGFFLALAHYLSAITIGFIMRFYGSEHIPIRDKGMSNPIADMLDYRSRDGRPFGLLMGDAVKDGINLILVIGGFIILFSVITSVLRISGLLGFISLILSKAIPFDAASPDIVSSFLIGFMEVTNGAKVCASLQIPLIYKTVMVSFMIGFGGLSVNAQVMSIIAGTDLKLGVYLVFKLVQGIMASIYSFILVTWFSDLQVFNLYDIPVSGMWNIGAGYNFAEVLVRTSVYLLIILCFMLAVHIAKRKHL